MDFKDIPQEWVNAFHAGADAYDLWVDEIVGGLVAVYPLIEAKVREDIARDPMQFAAALRRSVTVVAKGRRMDAEGEFYD